MRVCGDLTSKQGVTWRRWPLRPSRNWLWKMVTFLNRALCYIINLTSNTCFFCLVNVYLPYDFSNPRSSLMFGHLHQEVLADKKRRSENIKPDDSRVELRKRPLGFKFNIPSMQATEWLNMPKASLLSPSAQKPRWPWKHWRLMRKLEVP